jgi:DNA repair protein RadD
MIINLWEDQQRIFKKIVEEMRKGNKRILVRAETGAGKTVIAAYMIQRANSNGKRCAFDVPRKTLMHQTALTFRDFGIQYSYVASGKFFDETSTNWICSTQTWHKRLDQIDPDIIIIDEAHYGAKQRDAIIDYYTQKGKYIIGLLEMAYR